MLDVPCGDFRWMAHVDLSGIIYIGGDIIECVRTALELLLLALAADGGPVEVRIAGDRAVTLEGTMDLADERRSWQLRSGRRVLEGEGLRLRLLGGDSRFSIELTAGR